MASAISTSHTPNEGQLYRNAYQVQSLSARVMSGSMASGRYAATAQVIGMTSNITVAQPTQAMLAYVSTGNPGSILRTHTVISEAQVAKNAKQIIMSRQAIRIG